jgi:hypothetical protein
MIMTADSKPIEQVENQKPESEAHDVAEVQAEPTSKPESLEAEHKEELPPIPRKYVTDIVKRERLDAFQKGKKAAMEEFKAQMDQQAQNPQVQAPQVPAQPVQNPGLGGMPQFSPDQISKMIADEARKLHEKNQQEVLAQAQKQNAEIVANHFNSQMSNGKLKYADFDEKVKELDFGNMAEILHLATEAGNADDIMYDLANNPQKITHLMILSHTQPKLARSEISKLSASIKQNQEASKKQSAREPLDMITPSTVGADSGDMSNYSVSDFRSMFI